MRGIGVGIVGLGFGARVHLPGFRRLAAEGVEVLAVCGRDGASARRIADEGSVRRAYDDWHELLRDDEIQVVSVATPPATHTEIALAALAAGKAVLCEKPLAVSLADAEQLAAAAAASGLPALVDFEFRGVPAFRRAHELLADDVIGRVLQLDVSWHVPSRLRAPTSLSWKDRAEAGGGALLTLGIHSLDYVEWLLGPAVRVAGWTQSVLARGSADDVCAALLELADGTPVALSVSTVAAAGRGHTVSMFGERGTFTLANPDLHDYMRSFQLEQDGELIFVPEPTEQDGRIAPFAELARELVAALRDGRQPVPSFQEGARAQRLADAVRRSGVSGAWVDVRPADHEAPVHD